MLELMARSGMRVGEVLKITPQDLNDRKITIRGPKSGRDQEIVFIPLKLAARCQWSFKSVPFWVVKSEPLAPLF